MPDFKCNKCTNLFTSHINRCPVCKSPNVSKCTVAEASAPEIGTLPAGWNYDQHNTSTQAKIRKEFATALGIKDKGHTSHGSNFDNKQTKKQIMDNLLAMVSLGDSVRVRGECLKHYGYSL